jgi:hypothetical protein
MHLVLSEGFTMKVAFVVMLFESPNAGFDYRSALVQR